MHSRRARIFSVLSALGICLAAAHSCTWRSSRIHVAARTTDASDADAPDASRSCPTQNIVRPPLTGAGHVAIATLADGGVSLTRDEAPYFIRGAGGDRRLDLASACGANSTRTWGSESSKEKLDAAASMSMTVLLGVWLEHDAAKYADEGYKNRMRAEVRSLLDSVASHPALLMWSLGNEINDGADTREAWTFVQELATTIHGSDRHHPVATVIAGSSEVTLNNIADMAPAIDVVGVNVYAAIASVDSSVRRSRFSGPYIVTEWGLNGWWEAAKTPWGRPFEPTSQDKAEIYRVRYDLIMAHRDRCIGSYVFLWGQKQERTPTWFSMFAETNADLGLCAETIATTDVMAYLWGGMVAWPANRAPTISSFSVAGLGAPSSIIVAPGERFAAVVGASDPDGDALRFVWEVIEEPTQLGTGGSFERRPARVGNPVFGPDRNALFAAPARAGQYRLFVYALDGRGHAGTANLPFLVEAK